MNINQYHYINTEKDEYLCMAYPCKFRYGDLEFTSIYQCLLWLKAKFFRVQNKYFFEYILSKNVSKEMSDFVFTRRIDLIKSNYQNLDKSKYSTPDLIARWEAALPTVLYNVVKERFHQIEEDKHKLKMRFTEKYFLACGDFDNFYIGCSQEEAIPKLSKWKGNYYGLVLTLIHKELDEYSRKKSNECFSYYTVQENPLLRNVCQYVYQLMFDDENSDADNPYLGRSRRARSQSTVYRFFNGRMEEVKHEQKQQEQKNENSKISKMRNRNSEDVKVPNDNEDRGIEDRGIEDRGIEDRTSQRGIRNDSEDRQREIDISTMYMSNLPQKYIDRMIRQSQEDYMDRGIEDRTSREDRSNEDRTSREDRNNEDRNVNEDRNNEDRGIEDRSNEDRTSSNQKTNQNVNTQGTENKVYAANVVSTNAVAANLIANYQEDSKSDISEETKRQINQAMLRESVWYDDSDDNNSGLVSPVSPSNLNKIVNETKNVVDDLEGVDLDNLDFENVSDSDSIKSFTEPKKELPDMTNYDLWKMYDHRVQGSPKSHKGLLSYIDDISSEDCLSHFVDPKNPGNGL